MRKTLTREGARRTALCRKTSETDIALALALEPGESRIGTGVGFLDHLLGSLALHAGWTLDLACEGDLDVDEHHSVEDCALALGEALAAALAAGGPIRRFGSACAPLDEALARAAVDLSGRPYCRVALGLGGSRLGSLAGENVEHFISSFAVSARACVHLDVLEGHNAHHKAEAAFKAFALALRDACGLAETEASGRAAAGASAAASGPSAKGRVILEWTDTGSASARAAAMRARAAASRDLLYPGASS